MSKLSFSWFQSFFSPSWFIGVLVCIFLLVNSIVWYLLFPIDDTRYDIFYVYIYYFYFISLGILSILTVFEFIVFLYTFLIKKSIDNRKIHSLVFNTLYISISFILVVIFILSKQ